MSYEKSGINKVTQELLKKDIPNSLSKKEIEELNDIFKYLTAYTMYRNLILESDVLRKEFSEFKYIEEFDQCIYERNNDSYRFSLLSDFCDKDELLSEERYHKCHEASYGLTLNSPFEGTYLLTGYVNNSDTDTLHSVVEILNEGELCIIDYTLNVIMLKEDYLKITKFKEKSRLSKEELLKDKDV